MNKVCRRSRVLEFSDTNNCIYPRNYHCCKDQHPHHTTSANSEEFS
ncbi:Protein of unknown function [Pyronema omphalodes CBS 100304]|uniref:Uncharacterized protein n=1 Tax=Pyronema omphalodes (strain CBS 100304) TaxID=1076935 RepID=U4LAT8_PYROM|nr:Protein of unknown function [Pyronema omphalodes CBS 100304]